MVMINGQMSNCPLMNEPLGLCQMSFVDHIAKWQRLFVINLVSLFLLLFATLFILGLMAPQRLITNKIFLKEVNIFSAPNVEILRI